MATAKTIGTSIKRFLEHPVTGLTIGFVLAASGVDDLMDALEAGDHALGVHHGMIIFGAFKVMAALAEALERVGQVAERFD